MTDVEHGTYAGLQRCKKRPEGSCQACKKAGADYMAQRRAASPQLRNDEKIINAAADKARRELAQKHLAEYRELFAKWKTRIRAERTGQ